MDYIQKSNSMLEGFHAEFNRSIIERKEQESLFILECVNNFTHVMEASKPKDGRNIFRRFMDFLRDIMDAFKSKVSVMVGNHKAWLDRNGPILEKKDFTGVSIEITPYWNGKANQSNNFILTEQEKNKLRNQTIEQFTDRKFGQYKDSEGDLKNGIKNLFRHGIAKKNENIVKLEGSALSSKVKGEFLPFCKNYKNTVSEIESIRRRVEAVIKMIDNKPSSPESTVGESYFLIEESFGHQFLPLTALMESDKDKKKSPTDVVINKSQEETELSKVKDKVNNTSTEELKVERAILSLNQTIIALVLTVTEEKYTTYFKTLRGLAGVNANKNDAKDETSTDTKKEEPAKKKSSRRKK